MERPSTIRTTSTGLLSPYRWGARKWEDYLLDTQTLIYQGAREQVAATNRLADQQASHQQALLETFIQSANEANVAWDRISSQLDELTDQVTFGFTTLGHQLRRQSALLTSILSALDRIATALENPLAIQANELVRSGEHLLTRQLYAEAYADLTAAVSKRSVNPILHLRLSQLHYHVRDTGVPFDYGKAEAHILLAIRYATSLHDDLKAEGDAVVDLVHRTGAHIALVKSGDLASAGEPAASRSELAKATALLQRIPTPSPSSRFLHAQVLAVSGETAQAVACIRSLADFSRTWIVRALAEPNLEAVADQVSALKDGLAAKPGPHSERAYHSIASARTYGTRLGAVPVDPCVHIGNTIVSAAATAAAEFDSGAIDASRVTASLRGRLDEAVPALAACNDRLDWSAERYATLPPSPSLLRVETTIFGLGKLAIVPSVLLAWFGAAGMERWAPGTFHVEGFFRLTQVSPNDMASHRYFFACCFYLGLAGLAYCVLCAGVAVANSGKASENARRQRAHSDATTVALGAAKASKAEKDHELRKRLAELEQLAREVRQEGDSNERSEKLDPMRMAIMPKQQDMGFNAVPTSSYPDVDLDVLSLVPAAFARRYAVLPLKKSGSTLTVLTADPANVFARDELMFMTGFHVVFVVASESATLKEAIDRHYGPQEAVGLRKPNV